MKQQILEHRFKFTYALFFMIISILLALLLLTIFGAKIETTAVSAADKSTISVANLGDDKAPVYVIYWTSSNSAVKVERGEGGSYATLAETTDSFYVDYTAQPAIDYTYRITRDGETLTANSRELSSGKPEIDSIKIEAGVTSKTEASVIVTFKTDKLAKAQVFYGSSTNYEFKTELNQSLNQSHTILIEKLKPNTTYHFKVRAQDRSDKEITDSSDQTFTTAAQPNDKTIISIIIEALSKAFSSFDKWFRS